jgi:hypothetical protein
MCCTLETSSSFAAGLVQSVATNILEITQKIVETRSCLDSSIMGTHALARFFVSFIVVAGMS